MNPQTQNHTIIQLTDRATKQVAEIRENDNIPEDQYLRVGVKGGGCAGMSYELGFDHKTENDELETINGVEVIIDKRHVLYLAGIEVDFQDGLDARGFTFENPNASSTCGCGISFSA